MSKQLTNASGESVGDGRSGFFNPGRRYNLDAMRRAARKRAEREGTVTVIHLHGVEDNCKDFDDHEHYERSDQDV